MWTVCECSSGATALKSAPKPGPLRVHGPPAAHAESTFGKGKIQSVFELADGSALFVTVAKYQTPAGSGARAGLGATRNAPAEAAGGRGMQPSPRTAAAPAHLPRLPSLTFSPRPSLSTRRDRPGWGGARPRLRPAGRLFRHGCRVHDRHPGGGGRQRGGGERAGNRRCAGRAAARTCCAVPCHAVPQLVKGGATRRRARPYV